MCVSNYIATKCNKNQRCEEKCYTYACCYNYITQLDGEYIESYPSGKYKKKCSYKEGKLQGLYEEWPEHGQYKSWNDNGSPSIQRVYNEGYVSEETIRDVNRDGVVVKL